jgi:hypothetical protein
LGDVTKDANLALRAALSRNRAERRNAARLARITAAAAARRLATARRLFGTTKVSAVEKVDDLEPTQPAWPDLAAVLLDQIEALISTVVEIRTGRITHAPPPQRLDDVHRSIAAPRPGPAAGIAPAA